MTAALLIPLLGILIYSNTFHASFHFDDMAAIFGNAAIKHLNDPQIWTILPRRCLLYFSLALNYRLNGLNVWGYHVFNLIVHLAASLLVWRLTWLTFATPTMKNEKIARHAKLIALCAGLIFVSHPVQTQAVTYIVQRTASMAALFYLASLTLYVQYRLKNNGLYYAAALLASVAAMFTKETAITLPLMVLFYEWTFFNRKINWKQLAPFLLTIFIIPLTILLTETSSHRWQQLSTEPGISPLHYLLTEFRVMVTYIRLLFLPLHQNLDYDYPVFNSLFQPQPLASLLFLILVLAAAARLFSKYRIAAFGVFWFFLTLLPESSILPIKDVIYEHRLYLPLAGFSIFAASGLYYLLGKNDPKTMIKAMGLILLCLALLTFQRNKVWKDDLTLWDDVVKKSPRKERAYNSRGLAYFKQGRFQEAMADFNKALGLDPRDAQAYDNRGLAYCQQGRLDAAMADFDKAVQFAPDDAEAYNDRAFVYGSQGDLTQAVAQARKAIAINPYYADAYYNLGRIETLQGGLDEAIADYTKAIAINPNQEKAYNNRGSIYYQQGHLARAIADFAAAVKIKPDDTDASYNLTIARRRKDRL